MAEPGWTDVEKQTVARLWREGWTASRIAEALPGRSRNAVIGIKSRMGLQSRPNPVRQQKERTPEQKRVIVRLKAKRGKQIDLHRAETATVIRLKPPRVVQPVAAPNPFRTCQFIEGSGWPWTMCGEPTVSGHSWCEAHCRRVYQPREAAE